MRKTVGRDDAEGGRRQGRLTASKREGLDGAASSRPEQVGRDRLAHRDLDEQQRRRTQQRLAEPASRARTGRASYLGAGAPSRAPTVAHRRACRASSRTAMAKRVGHGSGIAAQRRPRQRAEYQSRAKLFGGAHRPRHRREANLRVAVAVENRDWKVCRLRLAVTPASEGRPTERRKRRPASPRPDAHPPAKFHVPPSASQAIFSVHCTVTVAPQ